MSEEQVDRNLALAALTHANRAGIAACEVVIHQDITWTATWQTAAVVGAVTLGPNTTRRAHVRLFGEDGRMGIAEGAANDADTIRTLVTTAAKAAGRARAPMGAPAPRLDVGSDGLGISDRRQSQITDEERSSVVAPAKLQRLVTFSSTSWF